MRISFFTILIGATLFLRSQSTQQMYLDAKSQFNGGRYSQGIELFGQLANDPTFGSFSTYYLGLCYYKIGSHQKGLDAWRQLLIKYPGFQQVEEVHFWMTYVFFVRGDYDRAARQAQEIKEGLTRKALYNHWLTDKPFQLLQQLQSKYDSDTELAFATRKRATMEILSDSDEAYIEQLESNFDIEIEVLATHDRITKDSYAAAVLLPFLYDDLEHPEQVKRNSLVIELYEGMMLAATMLSELGIELSLSPYDTRRNVEQTKLVLMNPGLNSVDLIIGPLLPEPIELVNSFSVLNKINVINPISSNSRTVANNPYAFQMKPSYSTMAKKAAQYVAANATKTESMIYFENKGAERILATEFQKAIKELGFDVTNFQPIDSRSAREVLARFSDQEENVLNITDEQAIVLLEEGRLIRNREIFDASGNLIVKEDGTPKLEYYELNFTFDTDSLDHIFAATRSNLLANNFVGAVESIPDTVRLIGLGDWLNFSMLDYHQLERLNVNLISSEYFDRSSSFYRVVQELCIQEYRNELSIYHMLGFESVWWAGNMMSRHGKYFQNGFYEEQDFPSLFYGQKYRDGLNDNQIVPIVQFSNRALRPLNLSNESTNE